MDYMSGQLSEIGLSVVLSELETTCSTGLLKIFKNEKVATAKIFKGTIVACTFNNISGVEAFMAMIVLRFETYSFIHTDDIPDKKPITDNLEKIFLQSYKILDETKHMKKTRGQMINNSNGYKPENELQNSVLEFISEPRPLDHVVEHFVKDADEVVSFIDYLNKSNNLTWSDSTSSPGELRISSND